MKKAMKRVLRFLRILAQAIICWTIIAGATGLAGAGIAVLMAVFHIEWWGVAIPVGGLALISTIAKVAKKHAGQKAREVTDQCHQKYSRPF